MGKVMEMEMEMEKYVSYVGYFVSVVFISIGFPLALNLIEPNDWYGIRISSTFQSAQAWYNINCIAGWALVIAGFISIGLVYRCNNHWNLGPIKSMALTSLAPIIVPMSVMALVLLASLLSLI